MISASLPPMIWTALPPVPMSIRVIRGLLSLPLGCAHGAMTPRAPYVASARLSTLVLLSFPCGWREYVDLYVAVIYITDSGEKTELSILVRERLLRIRVERPP